MSYQLEQETGDIVISGFEKGIAPSPHQGIASIRNANIATELGEVMCNFARVNDAVPAISGTLAFYLSGTPDTYAFVNITNIIKAGYWLVIGSGITGLSAGTYYVLSSTIVGSQQNITLSALYQGTGTTGASTGSATFHTFTMSSAPVSQTSETYFDGTQLQYRYYIAESAGYIWVNDTGLNPGVWQLIDTTQKTGITGIGVYNGILHVFQPTALNYKITCILGQNPTNSGTAGYQPHGSSNYLNSSPKSYPAPHFCLSGHSGFFYTDDNFVGSIVCTLPNLFINFSYGKYTASGSTITVNPLFAGSFPITGQVIQFFSDNTIYSGVALETTYYVISANANAGTFEVSATSGGSAESFSGGTGNQYFNSYGPTAGTVNGNAVGGTDPTFIGTTQACILPFFESATALAELGNNLVIGTLGNTLYVWDEGTGGTGDITPQGFIPMAENNCAFLLTVNNVVFDFRGQKGNIYVTSGSAASGVLTLPDYLAGTPGSPTTYIEPYWTFGQAFFQRGRVFFSAWDNNGNAGGVYSFVPSFFNPVSGQDSGLSLRLENYISKSFYGALIPVLINNLNQSALGVQYFSGWAANLPVLGWTYAIDTSGTTPYTNGDTVIETDLIPIGTYFDKTSFSQFEYKLSAPLASGESVQINWRTDGISSWSSAGSVITETSTTDGSGTIVSGYFNANFQNAQWIQLQAVLTSSATNPSFTRLTELRIISPKD